VRLRKEVLSVTAKGSCHKGDEEDFVRKKRALLALRGGAKKGKEGELTGAGKDGKKKAIVPGDPKKVPSGRPEK